VPEDGFARLGIKPQSMLASASQYLGALEDNARLSHNARPPAAQGLSEG
jgi:hypothetical protein